jgi:hypothetical protein
MLQISPETPKLHHNVIQWPRPGPSVTLDAPAQPLSEGRSEETVERARKVPFGADQARAPCSEIPSGGTRRPGPARRCRRISPRPARQLTSVGGRGPSRALGRARSACRARSAKTTFRVPSLSVPDPNTAVGPATVFEHEGTRLVLERAREALPGFTHGDADQQAIRRICARLTTHLQGSINAAIAWVGSERPQQSSPRRVARGSQ